MPQPASARPLRVRHVATTTGTPPVTTTPPATTTTLDTTNTTTPVPTQRAGDPDEGYRVMVNESYVSCGVPYELYYSLFGAASKAEAMEPVVRELVLEHPSSTIGTGPRREEDLLEVT